MGFIVEVRSAGSELLNLPRLLEHLAPIHCCQSGVLELWTPPEPRLQDTIAKKEAWAVQRLEYLRPFLPDSL